MSEDESLLELGLTSLGGIIASKTLLTMQNEIDKILSKAEHRANRWKSEFFWQSLSVLSLAAGGFLMLISLVYFMIEFLQFSNTLSFFIVALLFMLIGLLINLR